MFSGVRVASPIVFISMCSVLKIIVCPFVLFRLAIFTALYCVPFDLRLLVIPLVSSTFLINVLFDLKVFRNDTTKSNFAYNPIGNGK